MNDPFDFFDRIYCINLDRRPERWARVSKELQRVGLQDRVQRVSAVEGRSGAHGCLGSHIECVRRASQDGASTLLVLEDDVVFTKDPRPALRRSLADLQTVGDWDALYLGGQLLERPSRKLPHLFRAPMLQTHAIALHARAFERALHATVPVDTWYAQNLAAYGASPPVAYQITDESDISQGVQDRRTALDRSHLLFLHAPYPLFLAGRKFFKYRRRFGRKLREAALRHGFVLRFHGGLPRVLRKRR